MPAEPRLCFDRPLPLDLQDQGVKAALAENPANQSNLDRSRLTISNHPFSIAFSTARLWRPGRTIGVAFLDGTDAQRERTMEHAVAWLEHANLVFDFTAPAHGAEVRVSFADRGSWSALGTDCLVKEYFKPGEPTMNFGWLKDDSAEPEWRRVVLHEFGHMLGAIHEHSNPTGGIEWNEPAVYRYFSGPPNNWTPAQIRFNVLQRYSADQINGTKFDRDSIMLYSFPPELMFDMSAGTRNSTTLSAGDEAMAAKLYPKQASGGPDAKARAAAGPKEPGGAAAKKPAKNAKRAKTSKGNRRGPKLG